MMDVPLFGMGAATEMFRRSPKAAMLAIKEVPPWLKRGKFSPVLGKSPETTPRFRKA